MNRSARVFLGAALLLAATSAATAQEERTFGFEFEFAGEGNRIVRFEEMPFKNYEKLMRVIVEHYNGDPATIQRVDFTKPTGLLERYPSGERPLFKATWNDPQGRKWIIEPEFVSSSGYDGYELVTPPLKDTQDLEQILNKIRESDLVREGLKSGVHLTLDGKGLIKSNGDARALTNLILMHENMEPMLRRLFNPVRGGGHSNRFARQLAVDHHELLEAIDALPENQRTREKLTELFKARAKVWKYRSMNLAKALQINSMHDGLAELVEFRMFDLAIDNPKIHKLQADVYRGMVDRAIALAEAGQTVSFKPRAAMPQGGDPSLFNTPDKVTDAKAEARGMVEALGLDPTKFESLIENRIKPRVIPTRTEFRGMLESIPMSRTVHNGEAFTYGFEFEGRGQDVVKIMVPTDSQVRETWDSKTFEQKKAYYRQTVGNNPDEIEYHFEPDTRIKWLDPYWYVEGTGNWEIHSKVFDNLAEATAAMREAVKLTGKSGQGFHLHMRDNAPDWDMLNQRGAEFADFIERSSNWVWLERVRRLRTDLSLQSWSNARVTPSNIDNLSNMRGNGRSTVRVQFSNPGYVDIEIRGFSKYVDDIEKLARIYTQTMQTGEFGPWRHTDYVLPAEANGVPEDARFVDAVEEYLRKVEGKKMTPEMRTILEGLQRTYAQRAGSDLRFYSSGVATPLLGWEHETSLDEVMRRDLKFQKNEFIRYLIRHAERVQDGKYGVDFELASEKALVEMGLSEAAAREYVRTRALDGQGSIGEALRVAAMGNNANDMAKIELAMALDLNTTDLELLKERLSLTDAEVEKLRAYRESHDVNSSGRKAGLTNAEVQELKSKGAMVDIGAEGFTAEQIREATGISLAKAKKIVAFRDAHELKTEADLRAAGLTVAQARDVLSKAGEPVDVESLSAQQLSEKLELTLQEAKKIVQARNENVPNRWNDLRRAGISDAAIEKLKTSSQVERLADLPYASRWELEQAGLTTRQAEKVLFYVEAQDVTELDVLKEILGSQKGQRVHNRANAVDLRTADSWDLRYEANLESEIAEKLVRYRDAHRIGGGPMSQYNATEAAETLIDNNVLSEADRAKVERTGGINLETATVQDLTTARMGLTEQQAKEFVAYRDAKKVQAAADLKSAGFSQNRASAVFKLATGLDLATASIAKIVERTGLTEAKARKVQKIAKVDFETATLQQMRDAGLSQALSKRLIKFREAAATSPEMDYKTMVRELRLRVKKWVTESGLAEALLRSLLPRPEASRLVSQARQGNTTEGEGFGPRRAGSSGTVAEAKIPTSDVQRTFEAILESAKITTAVRLAENEVERDAALKRVEGLKLEIVQTNDILAERKGDVIRVSVGLLNEIHARGKNLPATNRGMHRLRMLGLILGHETAHGAGIKAERVADAEGLRMLAASRLVNVGGLVIPVSEAEIRETVKVFSKPTGASHVDNMLSRLKSLFRYAAPRARARELTAVNRGEATDMLARYRRVDGTLKWKQVIRDRALQEGVGLAHFGLALFLKEVAVVTATGDRARIEEFFDGLMTTDFYKHYGLFVVGARAGEVAYTKYLQRYVKPRFVNGILKTNLVLATGIALPQLVDGTFEGKAFAITLGSLGLSSAAVKAGMGRIKWVVDLSKVKNTSAVRKLAGFRRLARFGGWFYTAAELAVVLWGAEEMEQAVHGAEAGASFLDVVTDPQATEEALNGAVLDYHMAWIDYRNWLYTPLFQAETIFANRLESVARDAKLAEDKRSAMLATLENNPGLAENILSRHASLDAYAQAITAEADAQVERDVDMYMKSYQDARDASMRDVYEGERRDGAMLDGVSELAWSREVESGGFMGIGARTSRDRIVTKLRTVSDNRLQTYEDEAEVIRYAQSQLRKSGQTELADSLDALVTLVERTQAADENVYNGDGVVELEANPAAGPGLRDAIEELAGEQAEQSQAEQTQGE
jgi:DNA uptake protein ComE-like DNA-binding protein